MSTAGAGSARVGLVVPTLGRRPDFLAQTLRSIRDQDEPVHTVIVGPAPLAEIAEEHGAQFLLDPGGISPSINIGMAAMPDAVRFVGWLGDDDLLAEHSVSTTADLLEARPDATACFGVCEYVDARGNQVWTSTMRRFAVLSARIGPNLIPQPGSLVRRSAWQRVDGLDESLHYTMDLDLFLRLNRLGPILSTPETVAKFRWHADSTTIGGRSASLEEAYRVRKANGGRGLGWLISVAYKPTVWATMASARRVHERAQG